MCNNDYTWFKCLIKGVSINMLWISASIINEGLNEVIIHACGPPKIVL